MDSLLTHQRTGRTVLSRILVPTYFSRPARRAYTYAIRLAQTLSAELVILHVVKAAPGLEAQSSGVRRPLDQEKSHTLPELGRMAGLAEDAGVRVKHRLIVGIPDLSILDVAEESGAGMIVMGTHGRTGWDRLQFVSTAVSIVQKASCPVLTVHAAIVGDLPMTPRRLPLARFLVATDFQADAETALHYATVLATALGGTILLVDADEEGHCLPLRMRWPFHLRL